MRQATETICALDHHANNFMATARSYRYVLALRLAAAGARRRRGFHAAMQSKRLQCGGCAAAIGDVEAYSSAGTSSADYVADT